MKKVYFGLTLLIVSLMIFLPVRAGFTASKVIKFGIIGPMKYAPGAGHKIGSTMAAEEINAAGGILVGKERYKIELVFADSNELRSVTDAGNAMERLITLSKVDFILGGYFGEAVGAMTEVAVAHKKIFINSGSSSAPKAGLRKDFEKYKYSFNTVNSNTHVCYSALGTLNTAFYEIKKLGIKRPKIAILADKRLWTGPLIEECKRSFSKMGGEIVGVFRPSPHATDMKAEWSVIENSGAQLVYEALAGPSATVSVRHWGELQIPVALAGINVTAQTGGHWKATFEKANYEAVWNLTGEIAITPKTLPLYEKFFKREGHRRPNYTVSCTYDSVYLLKEAIERVGTLDTDAMVKGLEETDYIGAVGRYAFYPRNHELPHTVRFGPGYITAINFQWRDGKQVVVWPDGLPFLGDEKWRGVKYPGTQKYVLPPWVVKHWKNKTP